MDRAACGGKATIYNGDGKFADVSVKAGVADRNGYYGSASVTPESSPGPGDCPISDSWIGKLSLSCTLEYVF